MNWIVITIGVVLVAVLMAAAVGPHFVDWTAYRASIEARAERVLGLEVSLDGEAEVRLLPRPRLRLTDVALGDPRRPMLTAAALELDVDLAPLLQRRVEVRELRLASPRLRLTVGLDGTLEGFAGEAVEGAAGFDPANIAVQSVTVTDGSLTLLDRRRAAEREVTAIDLSGSARSLEGPFNAAGRARLGEREVALRLAGGALDESGRFALSASLEPARAPFALRFEGAARPSFEAPQLAGRLELEGTGEVAWSIAGQFRASLAELALASGSLTLGSGPTPFEMSGAAVLPLANEEPLAIALEARQLDLDGLARQHRAGAGSQAGATQAPPTGAEVMAALLQRLGSLRGLGAGMAASPVPLSAELNVGRVVAGGALVEDVAIAASTADGALTIEAAEAFLPGDTTLTASGRLSPGRFAGPVRLAANQPALLTRWWSGDGAETSALGPVIVAGDVALDAEALEAVRLSLFVGQSSASGRASYEFADAVAQENAVLDLTLSAPVLEAADVVAAAALLAAAELAGDWPDVILDVAAERLVIGRLEGSTVSIDADYRGDTLTVDALVAEGLAGLDLFASGTIGELTGEPVGTIEGTVLLDDGERLAGAVEALFSGTPAADTVAGIVPTLAPGDLSFSLSGGTAVDARDLSLDLSGTLGGTRLLLALEGAPFSEDWRNRPLSLTLEAQNPSSRALAGQLGIAIAADESVAGEAAVPASLAVALDGAPREGMATGFNAQALDGALRFAGDTALTSDGLSLDGQLEASASSATPLGALLRRPLPDLSELQLAADVSGNVRQGLAVDALRGTIGGVGIEGELIASADALSGTLSLGEADLGFLAALALGEDAVVDDDAAATWPTGTFAPYRAPGPALELSVIAERLRLASRALERASFDLSTSEGGLAVTDVAGDFAGGRLQGGLALTRDGARAELDGHVELHGADLSQLAWRADGEALASGSLDAELRFAGSGYTLANIIASASGEGEMTMTEAALRGIAPTPPPGLSPGSGALDADELSRTIAQHFAAAQFAVGSVSFPLVLSSGALRVDDLALQTQPTSAPSPVRRSNTANVSATVDLEALRLVSDWAVALGLAGEAPPISLRFEGPVADPERTIDASQLAAWLSLQQLEAQVEAVEEENEALEAEADAVAPPLPEELSTPRGGGAGGSDRFGPPAPTEARDGTALPPRSELGGRADLQRPSAGPGNASPANAAHANVAQPFVAPSASGASPSTGLADAVSDAEPSTPRQVDRIGLLLRSSAQDRGSTMRVSDPLRSSSANASAKALPRAQPSDRTDPLSTAARRTLHQPIPAPPFRMRPDDLVEAR